MPAARVNFSELSGSGEYTAIQDWIDGFINGAEAAGVSGLGHAFQIIVDPAPVPEPPTTEGDGPNSDVECTAPSFTPEAHVTYTLGYTDSGGYTFADTTYEIGPSQMIRVANGYNAGRQFTVLAHGENNSVAVPGALSTPLI